MSARRLTRNGSGLTFFWRGAPRCPTPNIGEIAPKRCAPARKQCTIQSRGKRCSRSRRNTRSWQSERRGVGMRNSGWIARPMPSSSSSDWGQVVNRYHLLQFVPSENGPSEIWSESASRYQGAVIAAATWHRARTGKRSIQRAGRCLRGLDHSAGTAQFSPYCAPGWSTLPTPAASLRGTSTRTSVLGAGDRGTRRGWWGNG
jgi:hypothetical protein